MAANNVSTSSSHVGKAIARGAIWTVSLRMAVRLISVVSTLVLARLLTPSDFGIYALATTIYAFIDLLGAFGFGTALIQNQDATKSHYNTAWTLHLIFAVMSSCLLFAVAPIAAEFFGEPQLEIVVRFMSILFLFNGLKNIGLINFQKHMTFAREFRFSLAVKLTGFLITIPLAFLLKSYWAMLWGLLASSTMVVILSYVMQPFRPRPELSRWRELISFSAWLQVNNILYYFSRHSERILVSRIADVAAVGSLQLAREVGQILREIVESTNRAVFPGYSKVNKNLQQVFVVFCDVNAMLLLLAFPVAIGLISVAHLFVPTVLGAQWLHIVPLVKWMALASLLAVGMTSTNNLLIALGKVKWATAIIATNFSLMVGFLLYLLPRFGVLGVGYSAVASMLTVVIVCYVILRLQIRLGLLRVFNMLYRPALSALAMYILVTTLFPLHFSNSGILLQLLQISGAIISGAACYVIVLILLWLLASRPEGPELKILKLAHQRFGVGGFLLPEMKTK